VSARRKRPAKAKPAPGSLDQWESTLTEQEKRIEEIVAKMQAGAWLTGVSDRALSREWNVAPDTVRKQAAEASRIVRRRLREDPEAQKDARAQIIQTFEVIRAKAMAKGDPASLRVALDATRAFGFYIGVEPVKRLDVTERHDPVEGWSVEEMIAYAREGKRPRQRAIREHVNGSGGPGDGSNGNGADDGSVH
jgi:hypothetical protein